MKTKNKKNLKYRLAALLLAIVSIFSSLIGGVGVSYAVSSDELLGFERFQFFTLNRFVFLDDNGEKVSSSTALNGETAYKNHVTDFVASYDCLYLGLTFEKDIILTNNGNDYFVDHCKLDLFFDDLPIHENTILQYIGSDIFDVKLYYTAGDERKSCFCDVNGDGVIELPADIDSVYTITIEYKSRAFETLPGACLKLTTKDAIASGDGESTGNIDTSKYTPVLQDLQKDENFNVDDYPVIEDDYSLQVIQIAESVNGELFVYVYQPCANSTFNATSVRFSVSIGENFAPQDYSLTLLSSNGGLQKYIVNNFAVKNDPQRYYSFCCIFRNYVSDIDFGYDYTMRNDIVLVPFDVTSCFTATTLNGKVFYSCEGVEVVHITDKYLFNALFYDGLSFGFVSFTKHHTMAHFLAFSTDWDIDKLFEVDVVYQTRSFVKSWQTSSVDKDPFNEKFIVGDDLSAPIKKTIYAQDDEGNDIVVSNPGENSSWMFGRTTSWKRIQSSSAFMDTFNNDNSPDMYNDGEYIKDKQWVVAFAETEYTHSEAGGIFLDSTYTDYTERGFTADNVSILRMKFKCNKDIYNLGVVDNYQNSPPDYDFTDDAPFFNFFQYVWNCLVKLFKGEAGLLENIVAIFVLFVVFALVPIFAFVFPTFGQVLVTVLKIIAKGLLWLLKGLWWLVCLPFKLIAKLFKKKE